MSEAFAESLEGAQGETVVVNARIEGTSLGPGDGPCFTAWIYLDYGGAVQGFGGHALTGSTGYTGRVLRELLETVGVRTWEDLPGKHVRVVRERGLGPVKSIGHIIDDKWFSWQPLAEETNAK